MLFSQMRGLYTAIPALMLCGLFVHMAAGATFAVVPFVNRTALGSVAGIVGAGGNAGAVLSGLLFKSDALSWPAAFFLLGTVVTLGSFSSLLITDRARARRSEQSRAGAVRFTPARGRVGQRDRLWMNTMIHAANNTLRHQRATTALPPAKADRPRKTVVVIGNGMVGLRFCEKLVEFDTAGEYRIVTFCEEPRAAYDRVGLTTFFAHRDAEKLMLARREWYHEQGIELHLGDRACAIDRKRQLVRSEKGVEIHYDIVVLATGSFPFVPPVPGIDKRGVFVYRTIEDLERIIEFAKSSRRCAVLGGGLLGLEAARAAHELGLETHVIEFSPRLMPRQIDEAGSKTLVKRIEAMGVRVHLGMSSKEVHGNGAVERLEFTDGKSLDLEMIIVSAGIRPRDDLAKGCGLALGRARRHRRRRSTADVRSATSLRSANAPRTAAWSMAWSLPVMRWPKSWRRISPAPSDTSPGPICRPS